MNLEKQENELLQWHPAFYAGLQIELQDELDNLIFENEHQLNTKAPPTISVLMIFIKSMVMLVFIRQIQEIVMKYQSMK